MVDPYEPPKFEALWFDPDERDEAEVLTTALGGLIRFTRHFWAALSLYVDAKSKIATVKGMPRDDGTDFVISVSHGWQFLAGRDGGMSLYHFVRSIEVVQDRLHRVRTLGALVDRKLLSQGTKDFRKEFKHWEGVRHSIGHSSDLRRTASERRRHSVTTGMTGQINAPPGHGVIMDGCFRGEEFVATYDGKEVAYPLNPDTHRKMSELTAAVYELFRPASLELAKRNVGSFAMRTGKPFQVAFYDCFFDPREQQPLSGPPNPSRNSNRSA